MPLKMQQEPNSASPCSAEGSALREGLGHGLLATGEMGKVDWLSHLGKDLQRKWLKPRKPASTTSSWEGWGSDGASG